MSDPVVVDLDGQLRALDPERREQLRLSLVGLDGRQRLLHPPEDDAHLLPLEPDWDDAHAGLQSNLPQLERPRKYEGGAERRMAREWHLGRGREDANARVALAFRLVDEDRLREVHLACDRLEELLRDAASIGEDGQRVSLKRRVREDVRDDVAVARHA